MSLTFNPIQFEMEPRYLCWIWAAFLTLFCVLVPHSYDELRPGKSEEDGNTWPLHCIDITYYKLKDQIYKMAFYLWFFCLCPQEQNLKYWIRQKVAMFSFQTINDRLYLIGHYVLLIIYTGVN